MARDKDQEFINQLRASAVAAKNVHFDLEAGVVYLYAMESKGVALVQPIAVSMDWATFGSELVPQFMKLTTLQLGETTKALMTMQQAGLQLVKNSRAVQ